MYTQEDVELCRKKIQKLPEINAKYGLQLTPTQYRGLPVMTRAERRSFLLAAKSAAKKAARKGA